LRHAHDRCSHASLGVEHLITVLCDDLADTIEQLRSRGVRFEGEPVRERWGIHVTMMLPGAAKVMLYEPHHAMAIAIEAAGSR
jgi:hypothetical protein